MHVDGDARTYAAAADNYQAGYRLKSVDGEAPLDIPRAQTAATADQFRLCFSCHDSAPFLKWNNTNTNFRADVNDSCESLDQYLLVYPPAGSDQKEKFVNKHYYHLKYTPLVYDSDFNGVSPDSPISCPACHNVHGPRLKDAAGITHAPAMIRTGELIGRESEGALNLEYYINQCPDTTTSPTNELFDATGDSTGGSFIYDPTQFQDNWTRGGVCGMCHTTDEPYWREAKDILNCANCHTSGSHVAHLEASYGPLIASASCDACHDINNFPLFSDGQNLANTTVCDPCHSPGGAYDGVNDPNIGAKGNWVSGVFNGSALQAGKEKWCVGCHDNDPSVVNGVSAPNIAGNDTSFGYYKTGHGKHGNEQAVTCLACHDPAVMHVDGDARTYAAAADNYQAGSWRFPAPHPAPRPRNSSVCVFPAMTARPS
jgi:hypothetical protein